jgi:hypothetical protein
MRGLCRFKVQGNLAPRFIGPFKILEKRGEVAYNWSCCCSYPTCMMCRAAFLKPKFVPFQGTRQSHL